MKKRLISIFAFFVILIPILLSCSDTVFDNPLDKNGDKYDPLAGVSIAISTEPISKEITQGDAVLFSCAATAGEFIPNYLWQISLPGTDIWTNLSETTSDLSLTNVPLSANGNRYRCIISYESLVDTTEIVTLTVKKLIIPAKFLTKLPETTQITAGDALHLEVTAEGTDITYSWEQLSTETDAKWTPVTGEVSNSYSIAVASVSTALNGVKYRCIVFNELKADTSTVTVTVLEKAIPVKITTNLQAAKSISAEETLTLSIEAEGTSITYKWEQLPVGSAVWEPAGSTTATLIIAAPSVTEEISGIKYRCTVSNSLNNEVSTVLILTVTPKKIVPAIIEQPVDPDVFAGTEAVFKIKASSLETIIYRWEKDGTVIGDNSSTLSFIANIADNGAKIVCVLTNSKGSTISDTVTLTVTEAGEDPFVKTQPKDDTLWTGKTVELTLVAENTNSLQWEKWNGTAWIDIAGAVNATLSLAGENIISYSEDKYRCRLIGVQNNTHSNEVTVFSIVRVVISTEPDDIVVYEGTEVELSFTTNGNKHNWQQKEGNTFVDLGITSAKHSFKATKALNGSVFRCKVNNDHGGKATTREITLTVNLLPVPVVSLTGSDQSSIWFSWGEVPNTEGVHIFRSLTVDGTYEQLTKTPITATEYTDKELTASTGYFYQLKSTLGGEFSLSSETVSISTGVDPTPVVVSHPENSEVTFGTSAKVGITSGNTSSREWFEKVGSATEWKAIPNSNSDTLHYSGEKREDNYTVSVKCYLAGPTGVKVGSNEAAITIKSVLPKVTAGAQATSVKVGSSIILTGTVSNEKSFKWQVKEATSDTWSDVTNGAVKEYTFIPAAVTEEKIFHFRFVGIGIQDDEVTSEPLVITVTPKDIPKIESLTGPDRIIAGTSATLTVSSSNGTEFSWEWYNTSISMWAVCDWPGAVNGNNTFEYSTTSGNAGSKRQFRCVVSNGDGETTSGVKEVSVLAPLEFTKQPVSGTAAIDDKTKFSVQANGTSYQWQQKNGEEWIDLPHTTSQLQLTVDGTEVFDGVIYRCLTIYDGVDTLASDECTLTIVNELDWMPSNVEMIAYGSGINASGTSYDFAADQFTNTADLIRFQYTTRRSLESLKFSVKRKDGLTSNPNKKVKIVRVRYRLKLSESWMNMHLRIDDTYNTTDIPWDNAALSQFAIDPGFLTKELVVANGRGNNGNSKQGFNGIVEEVTFNLYDMPYPTGTVIDLEISDIDLVYEDE